MAGIPIERLQLSVRTLNVLHKMSIEYIEQLIETPIEKIEGQRNAGAKTIAEIRDAKAKINSGEIVLSEIEEKLDFIFSDDLSFSEEQMMELSQHSIEELGLPIRAYNTFMRDGWDTVDKLAVLSPSEIKNIKGLGTKSASDTIQAIQNWLSENQIFPGRQSDNGTEEVDLQLKEYFLKIENTIRPIGNIYWKHLIRFSHEAGLYEMVIGGGFENISDENLAAVLEIPEVKTKLKSFFIKIAPERIIKENQIRGILLQNCGDIQDGILYKKLCDGDICVIKDGYVFLRRPNIAEYLEANEKDISERSFIILKRRITGDSLQMIGDEFGLTRERIRQILSKTIRKFPLLYEDFFREPYETFRFSKSEFCEAFPSCGDAGYEYLFIKYSKGKSILTEEELDNYHGLFKDTLQYYLEEKKIRHDRQTVSRTDIVYRVLISNSDESLSMEDFEKAYYEYIDKRGFQRECLEFNTRTVVNHLRNAKHIVFNEDNRVRFCDADAQEIWNKIDFRQYKDLVISASLIFRDYRDLMEDLDIRDGYELFYVIKSSLECWDNKEFDIVCRRVPVMIIGEGDEAAQAIRFLKEISPVEYFDYYEAYEERFGLHKESAQGNPTISGALSKYYTDSHYKIDVPAIDETDVENFKAALAIRKIWFIEDLEKVFRKVCVNSSEDSLNTAAFKRIGYSLNAGYAYNDVYGSVSNYFDTEIFSEDIIDLTSLDRRLTTLSSFGSTLDKKKKSLEYIETAPKILMSRQSVQEHYGLELDELRYLQERITEGCDDKYFNAHSIWDRISSDPVVQKLQNNEWMCTCVFRQQDVVFSMSVAGGIILSKNSSELNLSKVCAWIVSNKGKMTIQSLTNEFNRTFGTNIPYYKIGSKLKAANIWDDLVTDSIDDYLDALVMNTDMDEEDLFQEEFY